jgi:hypothetical protein
MIQKMLLASTRLNNLTRKFKDLNWTASFPFPHRPDEAYGEQLGDAKDGLNAQEHAQLHVCPEEESETNLVALGMVLKGALGIIVTIISTMQRVEETNCVVLGDVLMGKNIINIFSVLSRLGVKTFG